MNYVPPKGPKTDEDFKYAASAITRLLYNDSNIKKYTTEIIIEKFRMLNDDYDDWFGRGLRTDQQTKEFVYKLLEYLKPYGITEVEDNTFT